MSMLKPIGRFYPEGLPLEIYGADNNDIVYFSLEDQHAGSSSYSAEEIKEKLDAIPRTIQMESEVAELAISEEEPVRVFASINLASRLTILYLWRIPYRVIKKDTTIQPTQ